MRLLSLESLPKVCDEVLKYIQEHLAGIAFVTAGPAMLSPVPRPAPSPGDPYIELSALLQRVSCLRLATQRHPHARALCILDGWVPTGALPHPVLAKLEVDMAYAALHDCGIDGHEFLYLRGCAHESFERLLEHVDRDATFRESPEILPSLGDLLGCKMRLDALARGDASCTPFEVLATHVLHLPPACDDTLLAVNNLGQRAVQILSKHAAPVT